MLRFFKATLLISVLLSGNLLASWTPSYAADASQGNEGGHGGDPFAAEFVSKAYSIYARVSQSDILTTDQLKKFEDALKSTRIELIDKPINDPEGGAVTSIVIDDPLHTGQKCIQINKQSLISIFGSDKVDTNRYIFHEYLRVIGVEDSRYQISTKLDQLAALPDFKTIYIDQVLNGNLIPATGKGYPTTWDGYATPGYRSTLGCHITWNYMDDQKAISLAESSYLDNLLKWIDTKEEIKMQWKEKFPSVDISEENPTEYSSVISDGIIFPEIYRRRGYIKICSDGLRCECPGGECGGWEMHKSHSYNASDNSDDAILLTSGYKLECPTEIGFIHQSITRLKITVAEQRTLRLSPLQIIRGSSRKFATSPTSASQVIVEAITSAHSQYLSACETWKNTMNATFGKRFVYADCGIEHQERSSAKDDSGKIVPTWRSVFFESSGTVYFVEN
jgi:hypothetical protein